MLVLFLNPIPLLLTLYVFSFPLLPFLSFFFLCISHWKRSGSYRLASVRNVWFRPTLTNTTSMVGGNEKSIDIKLESSYQISMDWFRCDMWCIRPNYLMLQIMKIFLSFRCQSQDTLLGSLIVHTRRQGINMFIELFFTIQCWSS